MSNARRNADQVIAETRAHADKMYRAKGRAERNRQTAHRVSRLVRQRDSHRAPRPAAQPARVDAGAGPNRLAGLRIRQHDEDGPEEVETAGAIADGDGQHTIVLPDSEQEPAGTKG